MQLSGAHGGGRSTGALLLPAWKQSSPASLVGRSLRTSSERLKLHAWSAQFAWAKRASGDWRFERRARRAASIMPRSAAAPCEGRVRVRGRRRAVPVALERERRRVVAHPALQARGQAWARGRCLVPGTRILRRRRRATRSRPSACHRDRGHRYLRFDSNNYSLAPALAGRRVEVRVFADRGHGDLPDTGELEAGARPGRREYRSSSVSSV